MTRYFVTRPGKPALTIAHHLSDSSEIWIGIAIGTVMIAAAFIYLNGLGG